MFDTEVESAVLASLAELRTMQTEHEEEGEEQDYIDESIMEEDYVSNSESDASSGRRPSAGTACEGDIEDETTEDNDDSG